MRVRGRRSQPARIEHDFSCGLKIEAARKRTTIACLIAQSVGTQLETMVREDVSRLRSQERSAHA